jgi:tetratricopeptide (TPR) repeat protein
MCSGFREGMGYDAVEMSTPVFAQRIASGWAWTLATVFFAVPLAVDLSGLWAFLPVKEAILVGGAGLALLFASVSWAAAVPRIQSGYQIDRVLLRIAGLEIVWLAAVPIFTAANPHLHLGGAARLLATTGLGGLAAVAVARGGDRWRARFLGAFAAAGCAIAVIALLQAAGADPIALIAGGPLRAEGRWRVVATLGNPTWTGEFLAALLPITLFVLRRLIRAKWALFIEVTVAIVFAGAVLATGSRLAMVSLAVGLGVWIVLDERSVFSLRGRIWSLGGAAIAAVLLIVVAAASNDVVRERMLHVDSLRGRIGLAGASAALAVREPVLGHGLDHFRVALPEGLRSFSEQVGDTAQPYMPRTLVDHADSDLLEFAVEGGFPAAILMLAIWLVALRRVFAPGQPEPALARRALGASLIALITSSLGSSPLHTPATAALFWLLVGLLVVGHEPPELETRVRSARSRILVRWAAVVGALVIAVVAFQHAAALVIANRRAKAMRVQVASGRYDHAEEMYHRMIRDAPWDGESRLHLGGLLIARSDYEEGLDLVRSSQRWSASQRGWLLEARALAATGRLEDGIEVLENAVAALPEGRAMLVELGELYLAAGDRDAAADAFRRALASRQRAPGAEALDRRARDGLERVSQ